MSEASAPPVKCVVWDLDGTLWDDTLLEGGLGIPRPAAVAAMRELDRRGVLQSVASRNEPDLARAALERAGLWELFLHPEIHWQPKSGSVRRIAEALNIGLDTLMFVDDRAYEREEVRFHFPQVEVVDASELPRLLAHPRLQPRHLTAESSQRRQLYKNAIRRDAAARDSALSEAEFLATLDMVLEVRPAGHEDLHRAEELTVRTNQLNTTGYTYDLDELRALIDDPGHQLLVARLQDRFGSYGTIGLVLLRDESVGRVIKLFILSCRVMNRGVGAALLSWILSTARDDGVRLFAEFVATDRNRIMAITYRFAGFVDAPSPGGAPSPDPVARLEHPLSAIPSVPEHVDLRVDTRSEARSFGLDLDIDPSFASPELENNDHANDSTLRPR